MAERESRVCQCDHDNKLLSLTSAGGFQIQRDARSCMVNGEEAAVDGDPRESRHSAHKGGRLLEERRRQARTAKTHGYRGAVTRRGKALAKSADGVDSLVICMAVLHNHPQVLKRPREYDEQDLASRIIFVQFNHSHRTLNWHGIVK